MTGADRRVEVIAAFTLLLAVTLPPCPTRANETEGPIKIGVLTDMSSIYADGTGRGSLVAAQMAAEDVGGTVLGRPIQIIGADHQNKADIGASIARHWYETEGVDVIVDIPNSSVALAVQSIAREKNKIVLNSGGGTSDLTGSACSPNGIHWTYDTYAVSHGTAQAVVKRGDDTWFFITADYAFGYALARDASAEVTRNGGRVLGEVRAPLATTDFSSFLVQAQSSGAKVIEGVTG